MRHAEESSDVNNYGVNLVGGGGGGGILKVGGGGGGKAKGSKGSKNKGALNLFAPWALEGVAE